MMAATNIMGTRTRNAIAIAPAATPDHPAPLHTRKTRSMARLPSPPIEYRVPTRSYVAAASGPHRCTSSGLRSARTRRKPPVPEPVNSPFPHVREPVAGEGIAQRPARQWQPSARRPRAAGRGQAARHSRRRPSCSVVRRPSSRPPRTILGLQRNAARSAQTCSVHHHVGPAPADDAFMKRSRCVGTVGRVNRPLSRARASVPKPRTEDRRPRNVLPWQHVDRSERPAAAASDQRCTASRPAPEDQPVRGLPSDGSTPRRRPQVVP